MLLAIAATTQSLCALDYFLCCRKSKQKARKTWAQTHTAQDLQAIGIACTVKQFQELPFDQQLFLGGLKSSHVAVGNYEKQLKYGLEKAELFPEPVRSQLKQFCENEIAKLEFANRIVTVQPRDCHS